MRQASLAIARWARRIPRCPVRAAMFLRKSDRGTFPRARYPSGFLLSWAGDFSSFVLGGLLAFMGAFHMVVATAVLQSPKASADLAGQIVATQWLVSGSLLMVSCVTRWRRIGIVAADYATVNSSILLLILALRAEASEAFVAHAIAFSFGLTSGMLIRLAERGEREAARIVSKFVRPDNRQIARSPGHDPA